MPTNNNRRHTRLACEIPVDIQTESASFRAHLIDASRSGVRLRVPGKPLGLYRLAPMAMVGRQVARFLGVEFEARLNPELLGPLLGKRLRPVRIGQRDPGSSDVELGCVLSEPFTDVEAAMLGLTIPTLQADGREGQEHLSAPSPRLRTTAPVAPATPAARAPVVAGPAAASRSAAGPTPPATPATGLRLSVPPTVRRPAAAAAPEAGPAAAQLTRAEALPGVGADVVPGGPPAVAPAAAQGVRATGAAAIKLKAEPTQATVRRGAWTAHVLAAGDPSRKPFLARAERVGAAGVELRIAERAQLQLGGTDDVAGTTEALGSAYGTEVTLRIMDGHTHLWTGPARIEMVEVGTLAPFPVTLWLAYGRALRAAEQRALNLA